MVTLRLSNLYSKRGLREIAKYILLNLILWRVTIEVHEDGHWMMASLLKYRDITIMYSWAGGITLIGETIPSALHGFLIGISGGLWVSIVYTAFYLVLDWQTDMAEKFLLKAYILFQSTYAVVEAIYGAGYLDIGILSLVSMTLYPICLYGYLIWLFIYLYIGDRKCQT
jgi:hypothetical protein